MNDRTAMKFVPYVILGFVVCLYGVLYPNKIISLMDSVQIGFISHSKAANKAEKNSQVKSSETGNKVSDTKAEQKPDGLEDKKIVYQNPNFINALIQKEKDLDEREEKIKKMESKLQVEVSILDEKLKKLNEVRREIASRLEGQVVRDDENITKLVGIYSNMKPQNAAYLLSKLNEDLAVRVLKKMKKRNAGSILNFVEPKKAKVLSEKYSGY